MVGWHHQLLMDMSLAGNWEMSEGQGNIVCCDLGVAKTWTQRAEQNIPSSGCGTESSILGLDGDLRI